MVTFHQLVQLDIGGLEKFAEQWDAIHRKLQRIRDDYHDQVVKPLRDEHHWQGDGGKSAAEFCDRIELDFDSLDDEVEALRTYLDTEADGAKGTGGVKGLEEHQLAALDYQRQAREHGIHITDDGSVEWAVLLPRDPSDEQVTEADEKRTLADELERKIKDTLKKASEIDGNLARNLMVVFGTMDNFETESREFGILKPTDHDRKVHNQLNNVAAYMATFKGWPTAAGLVQHYLDGGGEPVEVYPTDMLKQIPQFQKDVDGTLGDVRKQPDGPFVTEWSSTAPDPKDGDRSMEWYYALNHFQYRLVGEKVDGEIVYQVEVQKRYDWGIPSEHRRSLDAPGGMVHLEQADIAHLNTVGMARDFDVSGRSDPMTASA
jgi:hypothetical protein